jgi:hypothetical protein
VIFEFVGRFVLWLVALTLIFSGAWGIGYLSACYLQWSWIDIFPLSTMALYYLRIASVFMVVIAVWLSFIFTDSNMR